MRAVANVAMPPTMSVAAKSTPSFLKTSVNGKLMTPKKRLQIPPSNIWLAARELALERVDRVETPAPLQTGNSFVEYMSPGR